MALADVDQPARPTESGRLTRHGTPAIESLRFRQESFTIARLSQSEAGVTMTLRPHRPPAPALHPDAPTARQTLDEHP